MGQKWTRETLISCGPAVCAIVEENRLSFEERLDAGVIDRMGVDLRTLAGTSILAGVLKTDQKAATQTQNQARAAAIVCVSKYNGSVRSHFSGDKAVQKKFGIGEGKQDGSLESVKKSLQQLISACEEEPAKARAAGILPGDVEKMKLLKATLDSAYSTQDSKMFNAKTAVADRNAVHRRLETDITNMAAIAEIALEDKPEALARFHAAMPPTRKSRKKKPAEPPAKKEE